MDLAKIKEKMIWDYDLKNEFKNRCVGYAFVIDAWEESPLLTLYVIKLNGCMTEAVPQQPPGEMMVRALEEQGVKPGQGDYHPINSELRAWIENNLF